MEQKIESKTPVFSLEEIPNEIHGVKLSDYTKGLLAEGKWSDLIQDMNVDGKTIKDGKIKLSRDHDGSVKANFQYLEETLVIPEKIGNHKLSRQDREDLENGKMVGPLSVNNSDIYLQVDKELNSVVVKTSHDLSASQIIENKFERTGKFEIGGYSLSKNEIKDLIAGKELPQKVFENDGNFFLAKVSITDDNKGLRFSDVKQLTPEKAQELKATLNVDKSVSLDNTLLNSVSKTASQSLEPRNVQLELEKAMNKMDFKKLEELRSEGFKPADKTFNTFFNDPTISNENKIVVSTIFDVKPENFKNAHSQEKPIESLTVQPEHSQSVLKDENSKSFILFKQDGFSGDYSYIFPSLDKALTEYKDLQKSDEYGSKFSLYSSTLTYESLISEKKNSYVNQFDHIKHDGDIPKSDSFTNELLEKLKTNGKEINLNELKTPEHSNVVSKDQPGVTKNNTSDPKEQNLTSDVASAAGKSLDPDSKNPNIKQGSEDKMAAKGVPDDPEKSKGNNNTAKEIIRNLGPEM